MRIKEQIDKLKKDFFLRAIVVAVLSVAINLAFIIYNLYLGIKFRDAFALGISIYYSLLFFVLMTSLLVEKIIAKKDESFKVSIRIVNYKVSSVFIFVIDFCLIAPIILMVTDPKQVAFGIIPAISMAAYFLYKIIFAILSYRKSKMSKNPTIILFKEISLISAVLSILILQHTLIMVNGGMNETMRILSLCSSVIFILLIFIFSIVSFKRNLKLFKLEGQLKKSDQ